MTSRSSVAPGRTVMRPLKRVELPHALLPTHADHLVAPVKRVLHHVRPSFPEAPTMQTLIARLPYVSSSPQCCGSWRKRPGIPSGAPSLPGEAHSSSITQTRFQPTTRRASAREASCSAGFRDRPRTRPALAIRSRRRLLATASAADASPSWSCSGSAMRSRRPPGLDCESGRPRGRSGVTCRAMVSVFWTVASSAVACAHGGGH